MEVSPENRGAQATNSSGCFGWSWGKQVDLLQTGPGESHSTLGEGHPVASKLGRGTGEKCWQRWLASRKRLEKRDCRCQWRMRAMKIQEMCQPEGRLICHLLSFQLIL